MSLSHATQQKFESGYSLAPYFAIWKGFVGEVDFHSPGAKPVSFYIIVR